VRQRERAGGTAAVRVTAGGRAGFPARRRQRPAAAAVGDGCGPGPIGAIQYR